MAGVGMLTQMCLAMSLTSAPTTSPATEMASAPGRAVTCQQGGSAGDSGARTPKPSPDVIDTTPARASFEWEDHPTFRYGTNFRIEFQAKFQEDFHQSYEGAGATAGFSTFELHRNRVGIQGTLFKHIEFEVERELTEKELTSEEEAAGLTQRSAWKDVNVNLDYLRRVQVRAGKFKIPFGLDELTSVAQGDFVYRSLGADYLAPARNIGVMAHGRFFDRGLNYWAGVFTHDGDNARSTKIHGGDETLAVRVTGTPFRPLAWPGGRSLTLGTALTASVLSDDSSRPNGLRGRTVVTEDTFFSPVYVKGRRWRWEGDIDWTVGPASVRAEYTQVTDDRLSQGIGDEDLPDARYRSGYVAASYLLTGEQKTRPVRPESDFLRGSAGAMELVARYERLWIHSVGGLAEPNRTPRAETILPSGDRVLTVGVNWILNRWVKVQINGIRERVEDPARNPVPDGAAFWSRVVRFQLVL